MPEFSPEVFASLWKSARQNESPQDPELARLQKFMLMHDDMHALFDAFIESGAAQPPVRDGENLMLHILMDASTEKALEQDQPAGIRRLMQGMLDGGLDPGTAFHVLSQAMQHEFLTAASQGQDMDLNKFMMRAGQYVQQAFGQRHQANRRAQ